MRPALGILFLLLCVALSSTVRVQKALRDPGFDAEHPTGILRSDPALLYYFTERILESGGGVPADFRADPRVQYPDRVDLPSMFTIGQEFLVAWAYRMLGGEMPLHLFCVYFFAVVASLTMVGTYGLAWVWTGKVHLACLAAALFTLTTANYRTVGFVLIREDLSFPLYALHLFLAAEVARRARAGTVLAASACLVLAAATWHAMGFFLALEVGCVFAWFLRTGQNPLAGRRAFLWFAPVILGGLLVPVLRSKGFLLSAPVLLGGVLFVAARCPPLQRSPRARVLGSLLVALAFVLASLGISRLVTGGPGDYGHVFSFVRDKVRFLGRLPEDPTRLAFGSRILWQGPFDTASLWDLLRSLLIGLLVVASALPLALRGWLGSAAVASQGLRHGLTVACLLIWVGAAVLLVQHTGGQLAPWILIVLVVSPLAAVGLRSEPLDPPLLVASLFALASLCTSYLIERTVILPGCLLPALAVAFLARSTRRVPGYVAPVVALVALAAQASVFAGPYFERARIEWYKGEGRKPQLEHLIAWLQDPACEVPVDAAVASDYVNSTAVLAMTRRPILLQPKYETTESRQRAEAFLTAVLAGSPAELAAWMDAHGCEYFLADRLTLWGNRYLAGIPESERIPRAGTPISYCGSASTEQVTALPGFRLLYRTPPEMAASQQNPFGDMYRVYRREAP